MTLPRRYTYTDYLQLPDDQRYEVMGGRLFMTPAPKGRHQTVVSRIAAILFLSKERLSMYDEEGPLRGAPDLVIEVLSPSTAQRDRVEKRALYARSGVRVYWLVDPEDRSITRISFPTDDETTYRLGDTLAEPVLPGFALPVEELIHLD